MEPGQWNLKKKLYSLFHGCDIIAFSQEVSVIPSETRGFLLQHLRSVMSLPGLCLALLGRRCQSLGAWTFRFTAARGFLQTTSSWPWGSLHWDWCEENRHGMCKWTHRTLPLVKHLVFTSDTHRNYSRQRSSQRNVSCFQLQQTAITSSTNSIKATDYNAIAQHIAIQNGSSYLTREQKICFQLNSLILYSLWCKDSKSYQSTPSLFL